MKLTIILDIPDNLDCHGCQFLCSTADGDYERCDLFNKTLFGGEFDYKEGRWTIIPCDTCRKSREHNETNCNNG